MNIPQLLPNLNPVINSDLFKEFEDWLVSQYDTLDPSYEKKISEIKVGTIPQHTNKMRVRNSVYVCALIANEVYKKPEDRKTAMPMGLFLDSNRNTLRTCVYKSDLSTNDYFILGIRGTSPLSLVDIGSDIKILFGDEDKSLRTQYQTDYMSKLVKDLQDEGYDPNESYITGSSLGGLLTAISLVVVPSIGTGIGFNTGASPAQSVKKIVGMPKWTQAAFTDPRFYNYHMEGDMISLFSTHLFRNNIIIKPAVKPMGSLEAHSMKFLIDNIYSDNIQPVLPTGRRAPRDVIDNGETIKILDKNSLDSLFVDLEK